MYSYGCNDENAVTVRPRIREYHTGETSTLSEMWEHVRGLSLSTISLSKLLKLDDVKTQ